MPMNSFRRFCCAALWLSLGFRVVAVERFPFLEPVHPPRKVQVMVHRGAAGQAPENTRPALARCIEDGFEWVEIDVRLARDGQHVVWHDGDLGSLGQPSMKIRETTVAGLQAVDAGSWFAARYKGERLLTLREALALARQRINLYLDCKDIDPALLVKEVREAGMERQVVVFDQSDRLQALRGIAGHSLALMGKWRPADGVAGWVAAVGPEAVELDAGDVRPDVVEAFHLLGIRVQAKCLGVLDNVKTWAKVEDEGVDWVQTDFPEEVVAARWSRSTARRPVMISLHRGANRYAPENTIEAFQKAARLGADFVEFDVRTTRDGQFYLLHDGRLDRTTDGHGPISEATTELVRDLSAGAWFGKRFASTRVPTLDEFLEAVPRSVQLYFDAKAIPAEALSAALKRHGLSERTVVYQSVEYLTKLKALDPRIRSLPPLKRLEDIAGLAAGLRPYAVDADWASLSAALIERCHAAGIRVFSDAMDGNESVERYRQAIGWGIDLIQTDHPMRVYRAMELETAPRAARSK